jgi:hypothetical protein
MPRNKKAAQRKAASLRDIPTKEFEVASVDQSLVDCHE